MISSSAAPGSSSAMASASNAPARRKWRRCATPRSITGAIPRAVGAPDMVGANSITGRAVLATGLASLRGLAAPAIRSAGRLITQSRAKHNQGFYGPTPVTEVSVNFKIEVQRVRLNLRKSGLGAAYWARVSRLEHERCILKTHVLCHLDHLNSPISENARRPVIADAAADVAADITAGPGERDRSPRNHGGGLHQVGGECGRRCRHRFYQNGQTTRLKPL
jgi:hypothetical protein